MHDMLVSREKFEVEEADQTLLRSTVTAYQYQPLPLSLPHCHFKCADVHARNHSQAHENVCVHFLVSSSSWRLTM